MRGLIGSSERNALEVPVILHSAYPHSFLTAAILLQPSLESHTEKLFLDERKFPLYNLHVNYFQR